MYVYSVWFLCILCRSQWHRVAVLFVVVSLTGSYGIEKYRTRTHRRPLWPDSGHMMKRLGD